MPPEAPVHEIAPRSGTAFTLVGRGDEKSLAAIETLIGQPIPRAEPAAGVAAPALDDLDHADEPRPARSRSRERDGARKPRGEGRRSAAGRAPRSENQPRPENQEARQPRPEAAAPAAAAPHAPRAAQPQRPPSIGRAHEARPARDAASEPGDHSHLPAFLLRPVRVRV